MTEIKPLEANIYFKEIGRGQEGGQTHQHFMPRSVLHRESIGIVSAGWCLVWGQVVRHNWLFHTLLFNNTLSEATRTVIGKSSQHPWLDQSGIVEQVIHAWILLSKKYTISLSQIVVSVTRVLLAMARGIQRNQFSSRYALLQVVRFGMDHEIKQAGHSFIAFLVAHCSSPFKSVHFFIHPITLVNAGIISRRDESQHYALFFFKFWMMSSAHNVVHSASNHIRVMNMLMREDFEHKCRVQCYRKSMSMPLDTVTNALFEHEHPWRLFVGPDWNSHIRKYLICISVDHVRDHRDIGIQHMFFSPPNVSG